jgi:uncharacterized protein YjbJ (UPF0337 family)
MNWDQIQGKWKQLKGNARQKWAKLTDDDLEYIAGNREHFAGRLQERYGIAREEAERQLDAWQKTVSEPQSSKSQGGGRP